MKVLYYIVLAVWYVFSLLPLRVHYFISDLLFWLLYGVLGYRKKVIRRNIKESFPEKTDDERYRIERGFYHFFCDYIVESVKLMTMTPENLKRRMVFKGVEQIDKAINSGAVVRRVSGASVQLGVDNIIATLDEVGRAIRTDLSSYRE